MATTKPRFSITLDDDLYQAVEDYRFHQRMRTQTQAIVSLIEKGLQSIGVNPVSHAAPPEPQFTVSPNEKKLILDYRQMNKQGKEYILQTMTMASIIYKNDSVSDMENRA